MTQLTPADCSPEVRQLASVMTRGQQFELFNITRLTIRQLTDSGQLHERQLIRGSVLAEDDTVHTFHYYGDAPRHPVMWRDAERKDAHGDDYSQARAHLDAPRAALT